MISLKQFIPEIKIQPNSFQNNGELCNYLNKNKNKFLNILYNSGIVSRYFNLNKNEFLNWYKNHSFKLNQNNNIVIIRDGNSEDEEDVEYGDEGDMYISLEDLFDEDSRDPEWDGSIMFNNQKIYIMF